MAPHGPVLIILCVDKGGQASPAHQSLVSSDLPSCHMCIMGEPYTCVTENEGKLLVKRRTRLFDHG